MHKLTGIVFGVLLASLCGDRLESAGPNGSYLAPGELDVASIIEPAPQPGDPRYESDRRIFRATRSLIGTRRWEMAKADAVADTGAMLRHFSCAVGVALSPQNAPDVVKVIETAAADTSRQTNQAKAAYQRRRPYTIDKGEMCQPRAELYDEKAHRVSYDYPSGHTTRGWTCALILASLAPDRAQQILERGRAYGDSRFVCGAHNESAVEAGMLSATATMTLVATKPRYQADLAAARTELAALRQSGPAPQGCAAETALVKQRVMPGR